MSTCKPDNMVAKWRLLKPCLKWFTVNPVPASLWQFDYFPWVFWQPLQYFLSILSSRMGFEGFLWLCIPLKEDKLVYNSCRECSTKAPFLSASVSSLRFFCFSSTLSHSFTFFSDLFLVAFICGTFFHPSTTKRLTEIIQKDTLKKVSSILMSASIAVSSCLIKSKCKSGQQSGSWT